MAFMDVFVTLFCIFLINSRSAVSANEHCFTFTGNSYLMFSLGDHIDNSNSAHYELQFKTTSLNGVLLYARGIGNDSAREALFIRGGNLHYHLFNPGEGGVGRQFGGEFVSEERVDNNSWITVHIYRAMEIGNRLPHSSRSAMKTGIEFVLNGSLRSYVDNSHRQDIDVSNNVYIGGYFSRLSDTVGNFTGHIRGIKEHTNNYQFENPTLNYKSGVDFPCLEFAESV